jgi:Xaa-Pro aminopeptidase
MNEAVRLRALRKSMAARQVEALIVTHLPDVRYLCGFTGSNAALAITSTKSVLFTDGRYIAQAADETRAARVVIAQAALKEACELLERSAKRASFDPGDTAVAQLSAMRAAISGKRRRSFLYPARRTAGLGAADGQGCGRAQGNGQGC